MSDVIAPDEVVELPGLSEAFAIRRDYETSLKGLRAFVSMGLRLIDVKARLPHGQYMAWISKLLPDLTHRHLHRSRLVAEGLCQMAGIKLDPRVQFEELPPEILALIDGASGYRTLLATVQEYRHDAAEDEARLLCEARWAVNPILRDEWEPKVLSGEITCVHALRGMDGQENSGQPRGNEHVGALLLRNVGSLMLHWDKWDTVAPRMRGEFLTKLPEAFVGAPPAVLDALEMALNKARAGEKGEAW
jgi:hypothetical protein